MSALLSPKVLVVGGGPGGYVAAIRAGQLGLETVLVEAGRLGGTCLDRGCIPSKALIHAAGVFEDMKLAAEGGRFGIHAAPPRIDFGDTVAWKDQVVSRLAAGVGSLLQRAGVKVLKGWATFRDAKTCDVATEGGSFVVRSEHVILANGSVPTELDDMPFGGDVISSAETLSLPELPGSIAIVGAGYIGVELGTIFAKMGSAVTLIEAEERVLPQYDAALSAPVQSWLKDKGVRLVLGARASGINDGLLSVETSRGEIHEVIADKVLVTVGRRPHTNGWGLENMGLAMDGSFIRVDERCATPTTNVWAIGDLVGEPMLAHKASAQGAMVAEVIAGKRRRFDPVAIPAVCFSEPEVVSVGLEADKVPEGLAVKITEFPLLANGRALSMGAEDGGGFVRIVARAEDHRILGVQAVGAHVSELSGMFVTAVEMGAVAQDIADMVYAHPTLGESFHEAALKILGHAIHV